MLPDTNLNKLDEGLLYMWSRRSFSVLRETFQATAFLLSDTLLTLRNPVCCQARSVVASTVGASD